MSIILILFRVYEAIIFARVLLSWVQVDPYHPVVIWIYRLTEPILAPIRSVLPGANMGFDFSPIVVILIMELIERSLLSMLY